MAENRITRGRGDRAGLVGRDAELAWLKYCLDKSRRGRPHLVILSGEPGIGKSKLARALMSHARGNGIATAMGRGSQDFAIPYMPLEELLRSLLRELEEAGLEIEQNRSPLQLFEQDRNPASSGGETNQQARFFLEISDRILELAAQRPLLLVMDDLHWLEGASLAILNHLVFAISDAAESRSVDIMLLLTTRDAEPESPSERLRARLAREPICESLDLDGLDLLGTTRLINDSGVSSPSSQVAAAIHRATSGNPLFIQALVHELEQRGGIEYTAGDAVTRVDLDELHLSSDVTSAARARLQDVSAQALPILELGALLGQRFQPRTVAQVLGLPEEGVLEIALELGLLKVEGDLLEFEHPLLRQATFERITRSRRQRMHADIAKVLIAAEDGEDWLVVHHLIAAGSQVPAATLFEYGVRAGDRAWALCGWGEAGEAYVAAAEAAATTEDRARLFHRAAQCFTRNYDYGLCSQNYDRALSAFRELGDQRGIAGVVADSARTALYSLPPGEMREVDTFNRCLDRLPDDEWVLRGTIFARMADAYFFAGRTDRGLHYADEALACGRESGDAALIEDACMSRALALQQGMRFGEAVASYRAGLAATEDAVDRRWENSLRSRLGSALLSLGEIDQAKSELELALTSARKTNDPGEEALAAAYLTALSASRGQFAEADEHFSTVMRLRTRLERRPWGAIFGVPALAYSRYLQGRLKEADDALAALDEPGRVIEQVGRPIHVMSVIYRGLIQSSFDFAGAGDLEALRARIERYGEKMNVTSADGAVLGIVAALIELADHHDLSDAIDGPIAILNHAMEAGALVCGTWPTMIPRALGLAAFLKRDLATAARHFEMAIAESARLGMLPELARSRLDFARTLVATGGEQAETRARDLVDAATQGFAELSMPLFHERARNLAIALGIRFSEQKDPAEDLQRPDLELLRRVSVGQSDGRVADDLLISRETVRERVDQLFERLGVEGRTEAAASALERGLLDPGDRELSVALLVTDLEGFTPMVERLGDAAAQKLVQLHNRMLRGRIRDHSGVEITHTGDGVIAGFRSVLEAVGCAIEIQKQFMGYNEKLQERGERLMVRIGVHAGEALREEGRLFGSAVNTAVRLCTRCEPGYILASEPVYQQSGADKRRFKSLGTAALKGIPQKVATYDLAWA